MKITELDIERFGLWKNLRLPLAKSSISVIYGPNEAGKSTLVRFLRAILFGTTHQSGDRDNRLHTDFGTSGQIRIEHEGRSYSLRREFDENGTGKLTATDGQFSVNADTLLEEILGDMDEQRFSSLYSLGLNELQELATLHDDEFVERIYGMSLGVEGKRLLESRHRLDDSRNRLLSAGGEGEIRELIAKESHLDEQLRLAQTARVQHGEVRKKLAEHQHAINDAKRRQTGIESQLRGHRFMNRVWKPWHHLQELHAELDALPHVESFPPEGLATLDELESEMSSLEKCRETLLAEAKDFRDRADRLTVDESLEEHASSIQDLLDQRESFQRIKQQEESARRQERTVQELLQKRVQALGEHWSTQKLEKLNLSAAAPHGLMTAAWDYRKAHLRRNRFRSKMQQLARRCHHLGAEVSTFEQAELGGCAVEDVLEETRQSLDTLRELTRLKRHHRQLQQHESFLCEHLHRVEERPRLPGWVVGVSGFFIVAGVLLSLIGIATGITTDALTGTLYALLGAVCGYFVWKFKRHTETQFGGETGRIHAELADVRKQLEATQASISEIEDPESADDAVQSRNVNSGTEEDDLLTESIERMAELEQVAKRKSRAIAMRRRLTEYRSRFRTLQHEARTARQSWCDVLAELGLNETVSIGEAFLEFRNVAAAAKTLDDWRVCRDKADYFDELWKDICRRVEKLGQRMQRWKLDYLNPLHVLENWERELERAAELRAQLDELLHEEQLRRNEEADYQIRLDELRHKHAALLVQGGATTREEFEERALAASNRLELQELIAEAELDLEEVASTEPDLALVEEDLYAYDADENERRIAILKSELADIDKDLQEAYELVGRLKEQLTKFEQDKSVPQLRLRREQIREQLKEKAAEWAATCISEQCLEKVRESFEQRSQPQTLKSASRHLERMSCGRHHSIWTPLATQRLRVDDRTRTTFGIEELSGGTREQLFLSIRFALIEQLRQEGTHLPFVLDDVFVNFDDRRSESAVKSLLDIAESGQQVLFFTCHKHLAAMFAEHGVEPIHLPGRDDHLQERRAG